MVSSSYSKTNMIRCWVCWKPGDPETPTLPTKEHSGWFAFGDAPWHADSLGQCAGTTMTTDVVRVVEFWTKDGGDHALDWQRRPEYEFEYQRED